MKGLYVIPKKTINNFKKDKEYQIINADMYEYEIEYETDKTIWISKNDTENFEYHV